MSTFYDDGGVGFAQEQFDNARKRRDKEAKKQDKFSRRLLLADLAGKGFNIFLNNKAEALEQEELFKNSNLFSEIESSTNFLNFYNGEKSKGLDDLAIFRGYVSNDFTRFIDPNNEGYASDARESFINDYVNDETNFNDFMGMVNHHKKIGSISPDQLTEFIKSGVKAPRNIGELIGNKIKKITMSHTDKTLQAKDAQVKSEVIDRLAKLGFNFGDSATMYQGSMSAIEEEMKKNPEKYKPYIKDKFDEPIFMQKGNKLIPHIVITKEYQDGETVFKTIAMPDAFSQTTKKEEVTLEQLSKNKTLYNSMYLNMDYMEEIAPGFQTEFKYMKDNPKKSDVLLQENLFGETIELGKRHILQSYSNIVSDPVTALEYSVASMYQNHQKERYTGKPSLYEIDMIILEKTDTKGQEGFDVGEKLIMYLDDFEENFTKPEREPRVLEMILNLPEQFTDEADKELTDEILKSRGYPTIQMVKDMFKNDDGDNGDKDNPSVIPTLDPFFQYNKKFTENPIG